MTKDNVNDLKKIAFVAMPFGIKKSGLAYGAIPSQVDFNALWIHAIKPALTELGYRPIRADEQAGTVIVKDMLEQLVHADLVVADISVPNGNVYYETEIRHAAKSNGCVLLAASWASPLFDLDQISQLRYTLDSENPGAQDYANIKKVLQAGLPSMVNCDGPIYELVRKDASEISDSSKLREQAEALFNFDVKLREAVISAESGDSMILREICNDKTFHNLPDYAQRSLVDATRDHLNWGELRNLIERLPEQIRHQAYFREQQALALGKLGDLAGAIALLEEVIERDGPTPDRYGNIGSRYRELANQEDNPAEHTALSRSIRAYKSGAELDLNDYYCAHKLLIVLNQRNRESDRKYIPTVVTQVRLACERTRKQAAHDEWLKPVELILSFYEHSADKAEELIDDILDTGWANWKLVGLLADLKSILGLTLHTDASEGTEKYLPDKTKLRLIEMVKKLQDTLPVPQDSLKEKLMPMISKSTVFKKKTKVKARLGITGEVVVSIVNGKEETSNVAKLGDIVVENQTSSKERYIVTGEIFTERYEVTTPPSDKWQSYNPLGEVKAIKITHETTTLLNVGNTFFIDAPWGEQQLAVEGDYFVSPAPNYDEIYRIAQDEFHHTYGKTKAS